MFKKLILVLALSLVLMVGGAFASEDGQVCTLIQGSKVLQLMPDQSTRPTIVPEDISINVGPEITAGMVEQFNTFSMRMGESMDWTGGNIGMIEIDFGNGPVPLMLIFKNEDVKDCR